MSSEQIKKKAELLVAELTNMIRYEESGPRPTPTYDFSWERARLAKAAALNKPAYGLCPVGCGCVWRDNFDGSMSLGINQRSCNTCERMSMSMLIPLYASAQPIEKQEPVPDCPLCEDNLNVKVGSDGKLRCLRCHGPETSGDPDGK